MQFYATIGAACANPKTLLAMKAAGMTGIRLNLSHGTLEQHEDWLTMIHNAGISRLLIDLQGPELRIGRLETPLTLAEGGELVLGGEISCPALLLAAADAGQHLLLDDGRLETVVTDKKDGRLLCKVLRGGVLQSRKSIAAPGLTVQNPTLTAEDFSNLAVAKKYGVTGVMLPFVRGLGDILALKKALVECGGADIAIFAKIENLEGVAALPEFLHEVDEVVIARGDLGNAMPLWELPSVQKRLAAQCRAARVPFMVVTQMLESMRECAVPTRAEVNDIYNAVLDGSSSVMLTGETAAGKYPAEAMRYLVNTAKCALRDCTAER